MSSSHRRETLFGLPARGASVAPPVDGLAAYALLAVKVAMLALIVARHAVWRAVLRAGPVDAAR